MFEKINGYSYNGVYLEWHPAMSDGGIILPEEYLHEINAKNLPDIDYPYFNLPNAKSVISSKLDDNAIYISDVTEMGVLVGIQISANGEWCDPLSPMMFFSEIKAIFDEMNNLEQGSYHIDVEFPSYELNYYLLVPSFNLKEVYDEVNNLLIMLENTVYKKYNID
jgi:hypothetical protein